MAKERWRELDVGALQHQRSFIATEEADAVVDVGMEEDIRRRQRQTTAEREVLPIVALSECPKERYRRTGDDAEADRVTGTNERRGLLDGHLARAHPPILPDRELCATL